jgi:hypothetical protein
VQTDFLHLKAEIPPSMDRGLNPQGVYVMDVLEQRQENPVADPVEALVAVMRPMIMSIVHSLGRDVIEDAGLDRYQLPLKTIMRMRRSGDGDSGNAFEYAIHDAVLRNDAVVVGRLIDALSICRINTSDPKSIFFAMEKRGAQQLIATQLDLITDESRVLSGKQGQPVKLKKHLNSLAAAFRRSGTGLNLPQSINGLWKADLFLGSTESDHWVGTTVKINPGQLEAAYGLRVAIVPARAGLSSDRIYLYETKNLIVCPLPHDQSFMQIFREGWRVVQALCVRDCRMPSDADLPSPIDREAARVFVDRRDFAV